MFVKMIKKNLHIGIQASPVGHKLRNIIRDVRLLA